MREDNSWRKCCYCVRFISYSDFDNDLVEEHAFTIYYSGFEEDGYYGHKNVQTRKMLNE